MSAAVAASVAWGQENDPPPEVGGFSETVSVGYVLVPVAVRSNTGYVTDLGASQFRLLVDGVEIPIDSFERGTDSPVNLVFLQDLSGSMALGGALESSRAALSCFLDRGRRGDEFALATFADRQVFLDVPFTAASEVLREAMTTWEAFGVTALYDAVAQVPRIAPSFGRAKRAVVLITDGAENASETAPEEAAEIVRRAELPVYVLSLQRPGRPARSAEVDPATYAELLRSLALATGGGYNLVQRPADAEGACARIFEELRSRYILGFSTSGSGEKAYRRLRVEVARRGLRVRTRAGYRGDPPG